ncbi:MAG: alpha/beta fold hydrolase [Rhodospirillaceae bacterium]
MPTVSNGQININYDVAGDGLPILFLHGFAASSKLWAAVSGVFSTSFRCLSMDIRGHGKSSPGPRHNYSIEALAEDALMVLDREHANHAILVGHAMGGMITQHIAARHPERIAASVFSSTTCFAPPRYAVEDLMKASISLQLTSPEQRASNPTLRHLSPLDKDIALGCCEAILGLPRYDLELSLLGSPALAIYGDEDDQYVIEGSKKLCTSIPDCQESIILGAGHIPQITHVEAYTEALSDFLQDLDLIH